MTDLEQRGGGGYDDFARDVLIGRVVDGEASPEDWRALADLASRDQRVWSELALTQRQHDALTRAVELATAPAEAVEAPDYAEHRGTPAGRLRLVSAWGGWAAAAALVLVWTTGLRVTSGPGGGAQTAGLVSSGASTEDAFDRYLDAGRQRGTVVRELPDRVVYQTQALESGGVEVLYLRQVLERRVVDGVYRRSADEFGRAVEVPMEWPAAGRGEAF